MKAMPARAARFAMTLNWQSWQAEALVLTLLALTVHAAVLIWVYPGFYDPLWPHHSDFYISSALAHSSITLGDYLTMPRPVGTLFLYLTGHIGIRGSMAANLLLVLLNCSLTAMTLRRAIAIKLSWTFVVGFALYLFLVFSHPLQYVWSIYDVYTQLSYFLLICAALLYLHGSGTALLFAFILGAFFAKETFALSTLFLCAAGTLFSTPNNRTRVLQVGAVIIAALGIVFIFNRLNHSPFISSQGAVDDPYKINIQLQSITSEWLRYAREGMSLGAWLLVAAAAVTPLLFRSKLGDKSCFLAFALPISGVLAWLPNSIIPNHHNAGYAWNGSYLIFAPILFFGALLGAGRWARAITLTLTCAIFFVPTLSATRYAANSWLLEQQRRQHKLLMEVSQLIHLLPAHTDSILVSGLDFPFSPFDHSLSLYSLGKLAATKFSVVTYTSRDVSVAAFSKLDAQATPVRFISPEAALREKFDEAWMFRNDGSLIRALTIKEDAGSREILGFSPYELMIFPGAADALGIALDNDGGSANINDGYRLLNCGAAFISYHQPAMALRCLEGSIRTIPENAYPYFYAGVALEQLHKMEEAKLVFEQAVVHDDTNAPNPAFKQAVDRVDSYLSGAPKP